jgi:Uma2 family endonuclease
MSLSTTTVHPPSVTETAEIDWSRGWREEQQRTPEGRVERIRIPLTAEEALHPKEGYVMPERSEHDFISDDLCDMLRAYFAKQPGMVVYRNLSFEWDDPAVKTLTPDVAVVPNVQEPKRNRSQFVVASEQTRPMLIVEIVSPSSREADRVTKVKSYARVGVAEYVYIDSRVRKGQILWEIAGYRLEDGHYTPMLPDEDGALYCATVDLRIGIEDGKVWLEDAKTGQNLLTHLETQQALEQAQQRATTAEARIAELEAQLQALQAERR